MSIIKGDIKKALGFSDAVIGEGEDAITIDLQKTTKQDIVNFMGLAAELIGEKDVNNLKGTDLKKIAEGQRKYFLDYLTDKDPSYAEGEEREALEVFILKNMESLQREFTIGFGLKTREQSEKDTAEAKVKIKKKV